MKGTGAFLFFATLALAACGKQGPPLPPLLRVPGAVGDAAASRYADDVFIRFVVPTANADGHTPADVGRVEVYAITAERAPTAEDNVEQLRKLSKLIASEQVRPPLPPLPPAKPGEQEPPAVPRGPGLDQGAEIVVRDALTADARAPVTLPRRSANRLPDAETNAERPAPLVAPEQAREPIRYYYAVAVSPRGRYGLVQNFMPIPLGTTSDAPPAPALAYDEKTITIKWQSAPNARGAEPPTAPGLLPSKSLIAQAAPTTYDVYEVPREAPANQTPSMPTALTPAPVGALEITQPISRLDVERCFIVRPVDIVAGYHVRGPASPRACVALKDTFPPSPPKSLAAVASAEAINLIWDPSDSADVAGYLVLRSRLPDATLAPATEAPVERTAFADRGVRPGVTYAYVVVAIDKAGNRSQPSNRVEETARQ